MKEETKLPYKIDGVPVEWNGVIRMAKNQYGYDDEIMQTSVAADILRKNGHIVENND